VGSVRQPCCASTVLAQVTVNAQSNKIAAFTPLLEAVEQVLGHLTGVLFITDAMHAQTGHAREMATRASGPPP
jgi:hypothetical protein